MCFVFDFLVGGGGADCLVFPKLNKYQHSQLQFFMSFFFLLIFFSCLGYLYLPIIFVLFIIYTSCLLYHALIIFILSHLLQNAFVTVSCTIQAGGSLWKQPLYSRGKVCMHHTLYKRDTLGIFWFVD